ncbi:MAG: NeuD/PglB/VioB family sugar acetyltransferase [Flavobacteriales bacterium]
MNRIALIGVNYAASLAADILLSRDASVSFSFFDDDAGKLGQSFFDIAVEGNMQQLIEKKHEYAGAIICIGEKHLAMKVLLGKRLQDEGIHALSALSMHSIIAPSAHLHQGIVLGAGVHVGQRASIGNHSIAWANATIEHDVVLGDGCYIGPGAVLSGCVQVGHCTLIGSNATILPEVKIGSGCKIGAGAVVTKDVTDGAVVAGVPAKIISI